MESSKKKRKYYSIFNHPEDQLNVPEPLNSNSINVNSSLPLKRNRKFSKPFTPLKNHLPVMKLPVDMQEEIYSYLQPSDPQTRGVYSNFSRVGKMSKQLPRPFTYKDAIDLYAAQHDGKVGSQNQLLHNVWSTAQSGYFKKGSDIKIHYADYPRPDDHSHYRKKFLQKHEKNIKIYN